MNIVINFPFYNSEHSAQVITGFISVCKTLNSNLEYNYKPALLDEFNGNRNVLEAMIDGTRVIFDTDDGYNIQSLESFDTTLNFVDFYFKRSFRSSLHKGLKNKEKLYPLGLNYYVTCPGNPLNRPGWGTLPLKDSLKKALRYIPHTRVSFENFHSGRFENTIKTDYSSPPKILFISRLWDGYDELNEKRIEYVRSIRSEFNVSSLTCGFVPSPLAIKKCPDLVLDKSITQKSRYIRTMKESDICITTTGLYDSIGWKFAEYVAAGKPILSEPLLYEVPGDFIEEVNYLSFSSGDSCISQLSKLLESPSLCTRMSQMNTKYYNEYMNPESMIMRVLKQTGHL